ncbi:hypothetical protein L7F22_065293 [Adiantum nelumboides]|nr:hypothetical protein [Adiantum nelumboides]
MAASLLLTHSSYCYPVNKKSSQLVSATRRSPCLSVAHFGKDGSIRPSSSSSASILWSRGGKSIVVGKRKMVFTHSVCRQAKNDHHEQEQGGESSGSGSGSGRGRRELFQATSIAGISYFVASPSRSGSAWGAPIVPPDLKTCGPATVTTPPGVPTAPPKSVSCCILPPTKPIVEYQLPTKRKLHRRRAAHKVDRKYIAKYNKAYELMKALPSSDPRNFMRQADIHCAFCNGAYNQLGSTHKLQIHFSWLFLPWHRWYLYFHERILSHLIGDPSFSLVYWNWDNQGNNGGNMMPTMFTKQGSALYNAKRNLNHLPPNLNTLALADLTGNTLTNQQIKQDNLNVMYQSIVTASTPDLFMGKKYSAGDPEPNIGGTLENAPHTAIHAWTGSDKETYLEDMGNFYSAAKDPIFFAHHANVDRLWAVWNRIGGRRRDHTDPDFLNAEFLFYDENGRMVRVQAKDALDNSKLGVSYACVKGDKLWLKYEPKPLSTMTKRKQVTPESMDDMPELGPASQDTSSTKIDKQFCCLATRPTMVPDDLLDKGLEEEDLEEVLVLEYVEVPRNVATHIAVFINLPGADATTPLSIAEYVGSFINVPHLVGEGMDMNTRSVHARFGISDNLRRLGITDLSTITVTVVAKLGGTEDVPISLKGIKIEYE